MWRSYFPHLRHYDSCICRRSMWPHQSCVYTNSLCAYSSRLLSGRLSGWWNHRKWMDRSLCRICIGNYCTFFNQCTHKIRSGIKADHQSKNFLKSQQGTVRLTVPYILNQDKTIVSNPTVSGKWTYGKARWCICPNSAKKMKDFTVFWAYSKWKYGIHPVERQICGHIDNVSTVYVQSKNGIQILRKAGFLK